MFKTSGWRAPALGGAVLRLRLFVRIVRVFFEDLGVDIVWLG